LVFSLSLLFSSKIFAKQKIPPHQAQRWYYSLFSPRKKYPILFLMISKKNWPCTVQIVCFLPWKQKSNKNRYLYPQITKKRNQSMSLHKENIFGKIVRSTCNPFSFNALLMYPYSLLVVLLKSLRIKYDSKAWNALPFLYPLVCSFMMTDSF